MTNKEMLDNLEADCKTILDRPAVYATGDLLNIVLSEDVPELIKFARTVDKALESILNPTAGEFSKGYAQAMMDLRKEIYGR
jgi:hypothetical protein